MSTMGAKFVRRAAVVQDEVVGGVLLVSAEKARMSDAASRYPSYDAVVALLRQAIADAEAGQYVAYAGIGSRETPGVSAKFPGQVCRGMTAIAEDFCEAGLRLRSGGAEGADAAFEAGSSEGLSEIYLPKRGHKGNRSRFYPKPENAHLTAQAEAITAAAHPKWELCSSYAREMHIRNVHQVLGETLDSPSRFVLAWTKDGRDTGGTGQAIRISWGRGIPVVNLKIAEHRQAICDVLEYEMSWFGSDVAVPLAQARR